jgi:hypothetical protein
MDDSMAPKGPIYIETSVWSAVVDPRIRGRQKLTRRFLRTVGRHRRLLVSDLALEEIRNHPRAELRTSIFRFLRKLRPKVLGPTGEIRRTTEELLRLGGWGPKLVADVTQLGYALIGGAEALATWNQKDLARAEVRQVVQQYCKARGLPTMRVGTPREVARWLGVKI